MNKYFMLQVESLQGQINQIKDVHSAKLDELNNRLQVAEDQIKLILDKLALLESTIDKKEEGGTLTKCMIQIHSYMTAFMEGNMPIIRNDLEAFVESKLAPLNDKIQQLTNNS